jgi:hypothetical protein
MAGLLLAALLMLAASPAGPRFLADDPLPVDADTLPADKPQPVELSTAYDVIENSLAHRPSGAPAPAANVDTVGEVPDSSWFTNRLGRRPLTAADVARGPATGEGPDRSGRWTVASGKSGGITPGFTMRDAAGETWFVKFDPQEYLGLSTAADVIGSRFFHALGYHVPENHVAFFRRDELVLAPQATISGGGKPKRPMTEADLDSILARAGRLPDGAFRCVVSRRLRGEPVGPFEYHGTRPDDPNDVFPHEDRRELRGLRVFSAWLNHDDSRSVNTLDLWLPGERHVRHHLIDFSSIMGAGSDAYRRIAPQNPRAGNEYILEVAPALRSAATFGIVDRPWRKVKYRVYPEVGRFEADYYRPEYWKGEYPNPAFERMRPADAFWAARILSVVTDEMVRAVVALGRFRDANAEAHLGDTLIRRRDKTVDHYFRELLPLADFSVEGATLRFRNLGVDRGLGTVEGYDRQWFAFDNATATSTPLGAPGSASGTVIALPDDPAPYLRVRLAARSSMPGWRKPVDVYLRRDPSWTVVGVQRAE